LYDFLKTTSQQNQAIEIFLAFKSAKALLNLHASSRAFELLNPYASNLGYYLPILKTLRLHITFCELYIHACRQVGEQDKYVKMCENLMMTRPMDWKNYFFLAVNASPNDNYEYLLQMKRAKTASEKMSRHAYTILVDAYVRSGNFDKAYEAFISGKKNHSNDNDIFLSAAVIENTRSSHDKGYKWLQRYYEAWGLTFPDNTVNNSFDRCLRSLEFNLPEFSFRGNPKVSVIMTCYNGDNFIDTSIHSVLNQTYKNLELIIVDDNSEDRSVEKIRQWAARDVRVKLIEKQLNEGTYVSKNRAILSANGDFITFLDSDDWMHPKRIEQHLKYTNQNIVLSYSDIIRITDDLIPVVRQTGGFTHMNSSSTFIRKKVFDRIGYFDSVRVGADSEFIWRTRHVYGKTCIRRIQLPLSFARHHENSLTTAGVAAFDESRVSPVRLQYWDSWVKWHCEASDERELLVPFPHQPRAFNAPNEILVAYTDI